MDTHTLELLEFDRLRQILGSYSVTSLGREACLAIEPLKALTTIEHRLQETDELLGLVRAGLGPSLGGLTDVRAEVRRAQTHATLSADEICAVANSLRAVQQVSAWLENNTSDTPRLAGLRLGLSDFTSLLNTIEGCLDARGEVLDTASRKLSNIRREIHVVEQKIQDSLKNIIRSLDARGLLRYPNYTMVGHHYCLPVIRERRGELSGSVQRTSASSETVYVEPTAIADQSAQLSFLRDRERSEIRRILHWLSEQIGHEASNLLTAIGKLAELDFALARARFAQDFRHFRPVFATSGIFLRSARHPLLEHLFREEVLTPPTPAEADSSGQPESNEHYQTDNPQDKTEKPPATDSSPAIHKPASPDIRFANLPAGMKAPHTSETKSKPELPAASPLFAQLPKAPPPKPEALSVEKVEVETNPQPETNLKGGLGLDLAAMAEKRRIEQEARRQARAQYQQVEPRRPERPKASLPTPETPRRRVTPIDVHLGFDFRILIVTGPNTGGKTVALKTLGLICLMAQCGLFIPAAEGSQVQMLDEILADIGDEQSLQQSLSTFSSHMKRMTAILNQASERTLVLLDEMGAGTDPAEGASLGRSIIDELDNISCLAVVTTHLGEMKSIAFGNSRVRNANVEFDLESLRPLYHLRIGEAGKSHALAIARRLNLPGHVVDRAENFLNAGATGSGKELDDLQKLRLDAEKARQEALTAQAEAHRLKTELEKALEEQRTRDRNAEELKKARELLKIGDRVVVPRLGYDRPGRIAKIDLKKRAVSVSIGHMKWDAQLDEVLPIDDISPTASPKPQYKEPRN